MTWRIGVDIGGTFTDVAVVDDTSGRIGAAKTLTTPRDFVAGVLEALASAMQTYGIAADEVGLLCHATTVVTNTLLEGKGARVGLVATRGFRDVLELRRSSRGDLDDLFQDPPASLMPRRRRFEITERIGADGQVATPLADAEIDGLIADLRAERVEAIAVSLLFSFLNPAHEQRLGQRLRAAFPDIPVYLSSEVLPEIREFERTSTTAVCAYVATVTLTTPDGTSRALPCKGAFQAPAGSVDMITPGSGGFGAPARRMPDAIDQDLADGYVTPDGAIRDYGVGNPGELQGLAREED